MRCSSRRIAEEPPTGWKWKLSTADADLVATDLVSVPSGTRSAPAPAAGWRSKCSRVVRTPPSGPRLLGGTLRKAADRRARSALRVLSSRVEAAFRRAHADLKVAATLSSQVLDTALGIGSPWGALDAERQLRGRPLNTADGMIAATALQHGLTLVTRNTKDFDGLGVTLFNPWEAV